MYYLLWNLHVCKSFPYNVIIHICAPPWLEYTALALVQNYIMYVLFVIRSYISQTL